MIIANHKTVCILSTTRHNYCHYLLFPSCMRTCTLVRVCLFPIIHMIQPALTNSFLGSELPLLHLGKWGYPCQTTTELAAFCEAFGQTAICIWCVKEEATSILLRRLSILDEFECWCHQCCIVSPITKQHNDEEKDEQVRMIIPEDVMMQQILHCVLCGTIPGTCTWYRTGVWCCKYA
jgi:hypothetical protein